MLTIRLMRFGRKHQPFFRLVLVPKRGKPDRSKYIELLGWVNPLKHEHSINVARVKHWFEKGAQPSATAWNLLVKEGILLGKKRFKGVAPVKKEVLEKASAPEIPDKDKKTEQPGELLEGDIAESSAEAKKEESKAE